MPSGAGGTLRVTSVRAGEVTFGGDAAGRLECLNICEMSSTGAGFTVKMRVPGALAINEVRVDVLAIEAGKAVVKVAKQ